MSHIEANHAVDPSDKDAIYTNNIELRQPFDAPDAQCAEFDARDMNRMGKKQEMRVWPLKLNHQKALIADDSSHD